jgi:alpha-D-ribose 1-methylphosphonate 5-triphosphate synthase subunit PhnG
MVNTDDSPLDENQSKRARWMGLLARANENHLNQLLNDAVPKPDYRIIRGPEEGLVMMRGRAGGTGNPFNLGEMTITRCTIELDTGVIGHAYVAGRRPEHAQKSAFLDALMQTDEHHVSLERDVITVLEQRENNKKKDRAQKTSATRVDFFTMVRGED